MTEGTAARGSQGTAAPPGAAPPRPALGRFARAFADVPVPFEVVLPGGAVQRFGRGPPAFRVTARTGAGVRALASLDEGRFGDAYLAGDLDIEGDLLRPFELRRAMGDRHPLTAAWRFVQPLLLGQVRTNRAAIASHYDIDPDFFLSFLDPATPCYTQGVYAADDEPLEAATLRKFDWCFDRLGLQPGDRVLEVGPGWGAWLEYASRRGVRCTGISISEASIGYLRRRAERLGLEWELVFCDLLEYQPGTRFDAVVVMGVVEHLPQYGRVARKLESLLAPGGNLFLDGSACTRKYELSSFMAKHIYPGNHSFLVLHDFVEKLSRTSLRIRELHNDRHSYFLTFRQWARNLEANRGAVVARFGEFHYRRFRLYLWGAAYEFLSRSLDCYRMVVHRPAEAADDPL